MRRSIPLLTAGLLALAGCGEGCAGSGSGSGLTGSIRIDGSSTVYPVSRAAAEAFLDVESRVRTSVSYSGTGGGFKKFVLGETDINDASRPIKGKEITAAEEHGVGFIELPVAYDGLTVAVHPENDWVDHLTVEELRRIWEPESTVNRWSDIREGWPDAEIALYGPGTDSGTFDYFTEAIVGKSGACRADFTPSENDNILVQGIAGNRNALGYFGYAYYVENADKVKRVPVDGGGGDGPVAPSEETINDGTYAPLSRPIFIYVREESAGRPEVDAFVTYYLENAPRLAGSVGYIPFPDPLYDLIKERFRRRVTGTAYGEEGDSRSLMDRYRLPDANGTE